MSEARRTVDAHAYVDGCLSAAERGHFEAAMARDARLRARVEAWRAQNEAMQIAFGVAPRPRVAVGRPTNENTPLAPRGAASPAAPVRPTVLAVAALAFALLAFWPDGGPSDPRAPLVERAKAALRASSATPLDFASGDPRAVAGWLSARLPGLAEISLQAPGWTLLGVRLVPGLSATAALVVFDDAVGQRAALLMERDDATPDWSSRLTRSPDLIAVSGAADGVSYAAVGPRASSAAALAPERFGGQPPR